MQRVVLLPLAVLVIVALLLSCKDSSGGRVDGDPDHGVPLDAALPGEGQATDLRLVDFGAPDQNYDFGAVGAALKLAFDKGEINGDFALLDLYDAKSGALLYSTLEGSGSRTTPIAVASASKWVTSTILLQLVHEGTLALTDTTAQHLGWTGAPGTITIEQLLGFTSGVVEADCINKLSTTLEQCVGLIGGGALEGDPDSLFHYSSAHLHVAGRIAEVVTQQPWKTLFAERIVTPLGLDSGTQYYTAPRLSAGEDNPLLAGGLVISPADYGVFLIALLGGGGKTPLIPAALLERQHAERWPPGLTVSASPLPGVHYGLGCWRHCATPADVASCDDDLLVHSAGAFGFVPFWDKRNGYYGVLGALGQTGGGVKNALLLFKELRPLIVTALGKD